MNVRQRIALALAYAITLIALATTASAQQAAAAAAAAANAPVTLNMGRDWALDAPPTWARTMDLVYGNGFRSRTDASVIGSLQYVGQRPTDLPYAIVEEYLPDVGLTKPGNTSNAEIVERIADYYRTAVNPPSKADRSPSWRRSRVSAIRYDATGQQFRFDATLTYDTIGDVHVVVSGIFDRQRVLIFSGWSDAAYDAAHPGELSAIRDSLRLVGLNGATILSPAASLRIVAKVVVGVFVVAVLILQIVVWQRDRRARAGETIELI